MPLSYNNNTPQASQTVASTQSPILTNFQSIDSAFNTPVGGVAGGGNFCSYSFQATTTNFTAKPVNPIGVLSTVASTNGNPELAWINNVNATGAGPYNGVQLTGGGITAAAWCYFVAGNPPTGVTSYNCTVAHTGSAQYTITFPRNFTSGSYASMINGYQTGLGDTNTRRICISSQLAGSIAFNATNPVGPSAADYTLYSCVFFGTLV